MVKRRLHLWLFAHTQVMQEVGNELLINTKSAVRIIIALGRSLGFPPSLTDRRRCNVICLLTQPLAVIVPFETIVGENGRCLFEKNCMRHSLR